MRLRRYAKLIVIILAPLLLLSCVVRRPAETPPPELVKLKIPESISRGEGKEPVLKVYVQKTGQIKELPFEQYVAGVVAGEMKNDWPEEALAAQAILARTFVMEFITEKGGSKYKGAHVSTDIEEAQAWNQEAVNDRVKRAVERTKGEVATYNDKYVKAWFHAHAGGTTASAKEGLAFKEDEPPYVKIVKSPDSPDAPPDDKAWTAVFSKAEILAALKQAGGQTNDFSSAKIVEKGPSGRAVTLSFGNTAVSAPEFRLAIGSTKMKSTYLTDIRVEGDKVVMKGKGYGHGVGMSQWGAYALAKQGKKAEDIVNYYFKNIDIVRIWE
ncbi:MAG: Stage II sporulation protein D (SpoIID) [Firmicutes bacterium]|nr:Stage II sporulation protein D (SpoIID) [Bacillota bacterium]MDI6705081.1 SpoIID/LytB domain-containing protein [Bacillota bacterium]